MYRAFITQKLKEEHTPSEEDQDLIRGFIASLMEKGGKASSTARRLATLKSFYKYLVKVGRLRQSPAQAVKTPKVVKSLPTHVPTEALLSILAEEIDETDFKAVRDRLIMAMLYECGLRRSELISLKETDISLSMLQLKVYGKGGKERIVPFGSRLKKLIEGYLQLKRSRQLYINPVFFVSLRGAPIKDYEVYQVVRAHLQGVPHLERRGAHTLRHSFATDMVNNGADLLSVKELLGHSSVSTTTRYTHTSFRQLKEMYNAHPRAKKNVIVMDIRIKAVHFDASEQLKEFIVKKVTKLERFADDIQWVEVSLKIVKPETSKNKEASFKLQADGSELFVDKIADTFEEAVDLSIDVLKRQLEKRKEERRR